MEKVADDKKVFKDIRAVNNVGAMPLWLGRLGCVQMTVFRKIPKIMMLVIRFCHQRKLSVTQLHRVCTMQWSGRRAINWLWNRLGRRVQVELWYYGASCRCKRRVKQTLSLTKTIVITGVTRDTAGHVCCGHASLTWSLIMWKFGKLLVTFV